LVKLEGEVDGGRIAAADAVNYVTNLETLVSMLGVSRVLARIGDVRRGLMECLPAWSHARFIAESQELDRSFEIRDLARAIQVARNLRDRAEVAGDAYPEAAYDRALAWLRLGRILGASGNAEEALRALQEARKRFSVLAEAGEQNAIRMEATTIYDTGDALRTLGRLGDAVVSTTMKMEGLGPRSDHVP
jgi:tetratricopeptide (TPR) repeat protein